MNSPFADALASGLDRTVAQGYEIVSAHRRGPFLRTCQRWLSERTAPGFQLAMHPSVSMAQIA